MSFCVPCMLVAGDVPALSDAFFSRLARMGQRRRTDPTNYLCVWCVESGLNPGIVNAIGARGLNQMMPGTLRALGAPMNFEQLSGEEQLPWIERLIAQGEAINGGPFASAARYYHSNFYPGTMRRGSSPATVVVARDASDAQERAAYEANKGLDADRDGKITLRDLAVVVDGAAAKASCSSAIARLEAAVAKLPPPGATWRGERTSRSSGRSIAIGLGLAAGAVGLVAWRGR